MPPRGSLPAVVVVSIALASALLGVPAYAATITIVPSGGFNDSTPVAPLGGNSGTTVGAQRLIAVQYAGGIVASRIVSSVEIRVDVAFLALSCSSTQGILGGAGSSVFFRDFTGAPAPATFYAVALANALTGTDQCPPASGCTAAGFDSDDMDAVFQSDLGSTSCLTGTSWYYGLDANPGSKQFDFVTVALHEIVHGLGFTTLVNLSTGAKPSGFDDAYMQNLEDHNTGKLWPNMSNAERAASSVDDGALHWVGDQVVTGGAALLSGRDAASGHVEMYAPNAVQPGSSVSHFSSSLSPDELMEPFIAGATHNVELTVALLLDLGWKSATCGNHIVDDGEECDDGDADPADGCTNACTRCGNHVRTAPEQCDDGNLVGGDGCEARCTVTGALPAANYSPVSAGRTDSASVNCQKTVATEVRKFLGKRYSLISRCLDAIQERTARLAAGVSADQIEAALEAAQRACVEPGSGSADDKTMLGQMARARRKAISTIEKKCGPPGGTTIDGKPISSLAPNDFSREEIVAHIDRVGCEVEDLIGRGYNGAAADLAEYSVRPSQGGAPLDQQFPCLGAADMPALNYSPVDGKKDAASVNCQKAIAAAVQQLLSTQYGVVSKCLNAIQEYKASVAAGMSQVQTQNALDAATRACIEPTTTAPDTATMLGQVAASETKATSDLEQKCGPPGGTTIDGKSIGTSASGDLSRTSIATHVGTAGCSVERLLGLAYASAATDLATHMARMSQGGQSLAQSFPCIAVSAE